MSTSSFTTVVFDLGGVLIDWNPRHLYRKLFPGDDAGMERFLAEVCTQEWNHCQDAGRSWADALALLKEEHPAKAELIDAYYLRWTEMLGGPIAPTVSILEEFKAAGTPLYALTNWSRETFPTARKLYPFLDWFDGIIVSGEVRLAKPDPAIFQLMFERFELNPRQTVYIDDTAPNIKTAAALGMHAILFTGAASLRDQLSRLGFLVERP